MSVSIHDRNIAFVNFVQACLGEISCNVRCIEFAMDDVDKFRFRFVLRQDLTEDREAIQDMLDNFSEVQVFSADFQADIVVSATARAYPDWRGGYLGVYCERHSQAKNVE